MEANNFIEQKEIQEYIENMLTEKKESVAFLSGKRTKIAIAVKNSASYEKYKNKMIQFDVTHGDQTYAVIVGV